MSKLSRRHFLGGLGAGALATGTQLTFTGKARASTRAPEDNIFIYLFLRGGTDGLNLLVPGQSSSHRANYESLRPNIQVPHQSLASLNGSDWGLHPAAQPLADLFNAGNMAAVHATGFLPDANRSHFDAQVFMELGTPYYKTTTSGFLTRHFATSPSLPPSMVIPALSASNYTATSLLADPATLTMNDPGSFEVDGGHWAWSPIMRGDLDNLYGVDGSDPHKSAGNQALIAEAIVQAADWENYVPAGGAVYPSHWIGDRMRMVAQMIKLDVGLHCVAVDFGGWDTHSGQHNTSGLDGGYVDNLVGPMCEALGALFTDLDSETAPGQTDLGERVTIVLQSEFGRRAYQNNDFGTDHGWGNPMFVIGGEVNAGVYGNFPGLGTADLFQEADVRATTDFRTVFAEIVEARLGNPNIDQVFPLDVGNMGQPNAWDPNTYTPLGLVQASV